jgi:histidinol-phosphate aminotransferase
MARAARDAWMYGDPEVHELREAIAARHGVDPGTSSWGKGSTGSWAAGAADVGPGVAVVTSLGAYPTFNFHVAGFGGRLLTVPYRGDGPDPEALMGLAREAGARLVYISNPDNPMGSMQGPEAIRRMVEMVPEGALLVLDEAYAELAEGLPEIDPADERVIRFRTFSKAQGLAGLRVAMRSGRRGSSRPSTGCGTISGWGGWRRRGAGGAVGPRLGAAGGGAGGGGPGGDRADRGGLGLRPLPSWTNFVALDCGRDGVFRARGAGGGCCGGASSCGCRGVAAGPLHPVTAGRRRPWRSSRGRCPRRGGGVGAGDRRA